MHTIVAIGYCSCACLIQSLRREAQMAVAAFVSFDRGQRYGIIFLEDLFITTQHFRVDHAPEFRTFGQEFAAALFYIAEKLGEFFELFAQSSGFRLNFGHGFADRLIVG